MHHHYSSGINVLLFSLQRCGSLLWRQIQGKAQVEDPNYLFSILDWEPHGKLQYKDLRFFRVLGASEMVVGAAGPQCGGQLQRNGAFQIRQLIIN